MKAGMGSLFGSPFPFLILPSAHESKNRILIVILSKDQFQSMDILLTRARGDDFKEPSAAIVADSLFVDSTHREDVVEDSKEIVAVLLVVVNGLLDQRPKLCSRDDRELVMLPAKFGHYSVLHEVNENLIVDGLGAGSGGSHFKVFHL
jgi:hypothetical protein